MVSLSLFLRAGCQNTESFVEHDAYDTADILSSIVVGALEHDVEEVCTLVGKQVFLDPRANERRLLTLTLDEAHPGVAEGENCRHIVTDVGYAFVFVIVRQEIKHDFVADLEGSLVHLVEVRMVIAWIRVNSHAQV